MVKFGGLRHYQPQRLDLTSDEAFEPLMQLCTLLPIDLICST